MTDDDIRKSLQNLFTVYSLKKNETGLKQECIVEPYFECMIEEIMDLIKEHSIDCKVFGFQDGATAIINKLPDYIKGSKT